MRFYPPKTTTSVLSTRVLELGEVVLNTDDNKLYIGNGITEGGIPVGQGIDPNTSGLLMTQISTPSEPSLNTTAFYTKSDGKLYYFPNGGSETELFAKKIEFDIINISDSFLANETKLVDLENFPLSGIIYKIESTQPSRIRLYYSEQNRLDDLDREPDSQILGFHGCYFDLYTDSDNLIRVLSPPPVYYSNGTGFFSITNSLDTDTIISINLITNTIVYG